MLVDKTSPSRSPQVPFAPVEALDVCGSRLSLVDSGSGESILLLHGYPQSHLTWRHQIPSLVENYRVIAPDWFGWGRSERRLDVKPRYWEEVDRIGLLLDQLEVEQVNLVGHDYGGFLSLGFAIKHPGRVKRLAVLNSRAHRTFPSTTYLFFWACCMAARVPGLRQLATELPLGSIHAHLLSYYLDKGHFDDAHMDEYVGWLATREGRRWLVHYFRYYEMAARKDLVESLHQIRCPTSLIWGDVDPFCPWEIAVDLQETIPNAKSTRLRGGNHYIMEERPQDVTFALSQLLDRPI